jgi:hypothetical protein
LIDKLRQLVSEDKIDEAIKLIKLTETLQRQEIRSQVSTTETLNATQLNITDNFNASKLANPVNNSIDIPNQTNSIDIPKQNTTIQSDAVNSVNATQKTNIVNDNPPHNDNEKRFHEKRNEIDSKNKDRKKIRTDKSGD